MLGIGHINLKVAVLDGDFYALQAINSYLAWDRRTRVTLMTQNEKQLWEYMDSTPQAELPDVFILDANHLEGAEALQHTIQRLLRRIPKALIICLAQKLEVKLLETSASSGARAFFLKHEVQQNIAWAIIYTLDYPFVITHGVAHLAHSTSNSVLYDVTILPDQRHYPEMTGRVRQAIQLCVIEGMPAHLAADEMAISLHTIRGYIKEGYRILEAYDHYKYPTNMTPQERAFMRFTALDG